MIIWKSLSVDPTIPAPEIEKSQDRFQWSIDPGGETMRSSLIAGVLTLVCWGVISADDTSKPVLKEPLPTLSDAAPPKETETPQKVTTPKPPELSKIPQKAYEVPSSHMAPAPSSGVTTTTMPRVVNADQLLYERAAYVGRQRTLRIEQRRWTGQSLSRPTIRQSSYAALNPYLYGYSPAYRVYPWW